MAHGRVERSGLVYASLSMLVAVLLGCGSSKSTETGTPDAGGSPDGGSLPGCPAAGVDDGSTGKMYYVDAVNGDDAAAGTEDAPFKTIPKVWPLLAGGDTVVLASGTYPTLTAGFTGSNADGSAAPIPVVFSKWVTFMAGEGQEPHLEALEVGTLNAAPGENLPFSVVGNSDAYLRFVGLTIDDGVSVLGSRYVELKNCQIHRAGELINDNANLGKAGVTVFNGRCVSLQGNDISHVGIGIKVMSTDLLVRGNDIHNNTNDGIELFGGDNILIEGNKLHDLDDGIDDGQTWGTHVDGIQTYFPGHGGPDPKYALELSNVTYRSNVFYHIESMGMMINAADEGCAYKNWVFENNVMGPVCGNMLHWGAAIEGFTFRHNTIVQVADTTWQSDYRAMDCQNYNVSWWPDGDGKMVYNNVFVDGNNHPDTTDPSYALIANNLYLSAPPDWLSPLERGGLVATSLPYAAGDFEAVLLADSEAIDMGTRLAQDLSLLPDPLEVDRDGNPRDQRPDVGAYEVQGRNPPPESPSSY
jgi:parallel beta-helix repeat protein